MMNLKPKKTEEYYTRAIPKHRQHTQTTRAIAGYRTAMNNPDGFETVMMRVSDPMLVDVLR